MMPSQQKNIVMDTHIFYWYVNQDDKKIPKTLHNHLDNADNLYVSTASCFELAWLAEHNRIIFDTPYLEWYETVRQYTDIKFLDIIPDMVHRAVLLPEHHKDPWDRIIIATALYYQYQLASIDTKFPLYLELQPYLIT